MNKNRYRWLLVMPSVIIIIFVIIGPLLYAFYISFHEWRMVIPGSKPTFKFLINYIKLIRDPRFLNSLKVTVKLLVMTLPFELIFGIIVAVALSNIKKARGIIISIILIPTMIAPIAVGVVWLMLFSTSFGPINYFLKLMGQQAITWTASAEWSLTAIAIAEIWQWTPLVIALFFAGIVIQPLELFEAATIDGATGWQTFRYILLPLLKPVILVATIFRTVDILKIFEVPWVLTQGGPGNATEVVSLFIYRQGFEFWNMTYASATSFILLVVTIILVTLYFRIITITEV